MSVLIFLIPIALFTALLGLAAFLWSLKSKQYDDLEGAANRILFDDDSPHQQNKPNKLEPANQGNELGDKL